MPIKQFTLSASVALMLPAAAFGQRQGQLSRRARCYVELEQEIKSVVHHGRSKRRTVWAVVAALGDKVAVGGNTRPEWYLRAVTGPFAGACGSHSGDPLG